MWKSCGSPLAKCKSKSVSLSLPHYLVFILGMAFCPQADSDQANVSYFAGGCFWCTDAVFEQARGVTSVVSGYMQGAETIQITFDPSKTSYDKLLNLFWRAHNPIEVDSQGPDTGKQYRSAIFYVDEQQHAAAEKSKGQAQKSFSKPIATEITRNIVSSGARKSSEFLSEKPKQSVRPTNNTTEASKTRPQETLSQ
jgi:peptide-methionine (S)-S-oxide reductase